ncbi:MAG TPA: hypothetical protein VGC54_09830, partial [Planctomycetota bacterium]
LPGRLATALDTQAAGGPQDLGLEGGVERAAGWLGEAGAAAVLIASPYLTREEGEAFLALARAVGAPARLLASPDFGGDDVLLSGERAPNQRGLLELGLEALDAETARKALATAPAALLAGEKGLHLLHGIEPADPAPAFPATDAGPRGIVLDTHPREGFALNLPARSWVEKSGRVTNGQGLERILRAVLAPPPGVPSGEDLFAAITEAATQAVSGGARG